MSQIRLVVALCVVLCVLAADSPAQAQQRFAPRSYAARSGTYQPTRQTLSPYLQLCAARAASCCPAIRTLCSRAFRRVSSRINR